MVGGGRGGVLTIAIEVGDETKERRERERKLILGGGDVGLPPPPKNKQKRKKKKISKKKIPLSLPLPFSPSNLSSFFQKTRKMVRILSSLLTLISPAI